MLLAMATSRAAPSLLTLTLVTLGPLRRTAAASSSTKVSFFLVWHRLAVIYSRLTTSPSFAAHRFLSPTTSVSPPFIPLPLVADETTISRPPVLSQFAIGSLDAAYDLVQEIGHIDNIDIKYLELSESFRTNTAVKDFVRGPRSHSTQSQQQVLATKRRKFFLVLLHFKLEYEPRF